MKTTYLSLLFLAIFLHTAFSQVNPLYVKQENFLSAIQNNNFAEVKKLLKEGAKINEMNYLNKYPFLEAAKGSEPAMLTLLLAYGADVNIKNNYQQNALHVCVENPNAGLMAAEILKGNPEIDAVDQFGRTPLFEAVSEGKLDLAGLLIEKGANVDFRNPKSGSTVLIWIARNPNVAAIKLLLSNGADVNASDKEGNSALFEAALNNVVENVEVLMKNGADPFLRTGSTNALKNSLHTESWAVLRAILRHIDDVNFNLEGRGYGLVHEAVINENIELLKIMIECKADLNQKNQYGSTPLSLAYYNKSQKIIDLLEENGAVK